MTMGAAARRREARPERSSASWGSLDSLPSVVAQARGLSDCPQRENGAFLKGNRTATLVTLLVRGLVIAPRKTFSMRAALQETGAPGVRTSADTIASTCRRVRGASDSSEVEGVYERCQRAIFTRALRLLGDEHRAQDIIQETFVRVLRHQDELARKNHPASWVMRIATNLCRDELRRHGRRPIDPAGLAADTLDQDRGRPDRRYESDCFVHALQVGLASLDEKQCEAFVLREVHGWSVREIAERLACPRGTVMSRLHYARRHLRRHMSSKVDRP